PSDATTKLAYADWLDERGEHDKAEYLRLVTGPPPHPTDREGWSRRHAAQRRLRVWLELVNSRVPIWDAATMFALGRLRGLLDAYAGLSAHESDIGYVFDACLCAHPGSLTKLLASNYGPDCVPVNADQLSDWEADLRAVLRDWLFMELRRLRNGPHFRLGFLTDSGRNWLIDDVMSHILALIKPRTGWRVRVTPNGFYALDWADVALEAADRVLFLHFSFSD
ncbi:MAG TPA: TIGR02996 domain-containing protein, partial [Gemmata sp.]|nr:TIGR02996 domain-containing protein [Gemmata sp.]